MTIFTEPIQQEAGVLNGHRQRLFAADALVRRHACFSFQVVGFNDHLGQKESAQPPRRQWVASSASDCFP